VTDLIAADVAAGYVLLAPLATCELRPQSFGGLRVFPLSSVVALRLLRLSARIRVFEAENFASMARTNAICKVFGEIRVSELDFSLNS
jgi:hypothetical protein